jgi:hypothetical protein
MITLTSAWWLLVWLWKAVVLGGQLLPPILALI